VDCSARYRIPYGSEVTMRAMAQRAVARRAVSQRSTGTRTVTSNPESALFVRAATYWAALILANAACLGLMALLFFR